jgi:hypothetical protein
MDDSRPLDRLLSAIARRYLWIESLETRKSDSKDFHSVPVWGLRAALQAAFDAGRASNTNAGNSDS